jgi:hypothetical protein
MKTTLIVLAVTAGAAMFAIAANLFPDWTWAVLNTARNTKATILGEKPPAINPSRHALPPNAVEAEQVSCPSLPRNVLYTIALHTLPDEKCSLQIGDLSLNNYGPVDKPLRGIFTDGQLVKHRHLTQNSLKRRREGVKL